MPATEEPQPTAARSAALPGYWTFVDAAQKRFSEEFPDADLSANRVFLSLNRASTTVVYDFESSIHRPAGGSWPTFRLLLALWVSGPLSPNEAALITGMSRAAVSNLTGPLVDKGLLVRQKSPDDGRSITLNLTEAGRERIRADFADQNKRESEWAAALTEEERNTLAGLLEKLMAQREAVGARQRK
ncbi:MarR family winged helix-turn-helix transcriptional regulator [Arthrobacter koreensis]|uniref:MarR family winged helix-turn-helix transcriptional regulator n=1 Tax=Arthrobacter koreensis TaxID=199136 RepID=UPI002DB568C2|nr:MarR family winged helix-turn-helix transcriptional regulator [Arthrobacter koreensis]MEB7448193.1 MarR family winged helix-turn-helix transcriptional regulator [Arthrobacter koreensis]